MDIDRELINAVCSEIHNIQLFTRLIACIVMLILTGQATVVFFSHYHWVVKFVYIVLTIVMLVTILLSKNFIL